MSSPHRTIWEYEGSSSILSSFSSIAVARRLFPSVLGRSLTCTASEPAMRSALVPRWQHCATHRVQLTKSLELFAEPGGPAWPVGSMLRYEARSSGCRGGVRDMGGKVRRRSRVASRVGDRRADAIVMPAREMKGKALSQSARLEVLVAAPVGSGCVRGWPSGRPSQQGLAGFGPCTKATVTHDGCKRHPFRPDRLGESVARGSRRRRCSTLRYRLDGRWLQMIDMDGTNGRRKNATEGGRRARTAVARKLGADRNGQGLSQAATDHGCFSLWWGALGKQAQHHRHQAPPAPPLKSQRQSIWGNTHDAANF